MKKPISFDPSRLYTPALALVFLIGAGFRVYPLIVVGFDEPFDLGGLFYQMSLEIARTGFTMPDSIPYYYPGGLPFAYPPLAFYIQAALISLFSPSLFLTVNLLPALFSVLSLIAFHLLACEVIKERWLRLAALFVFAIIPLAVTEQVQAMGLAESLGTGALILYIRALVRAGKKPDLQRLLMAGFLLALCVVSSPGSLYAAALLSLLYMGAAVYQWQRKCGARVLGGGVVIGIAGLLFSAPYWISVLSTHGIGILSGAFVVQNSSLLTELKENLLAFRVIWASPLWNVFFLFSLALIVARRRYMLLIFTLLMLVIIRERWIVSIPVSLVMGLGVGVLLDLLGSIRLRKVALVKVSLVWVVILLLLYDAGAYLAFMVKDKTYDLPPVKVAELNEMHSFGLIPPEKAVVTIGNRGLVEWAPTLLERNVLNNPYGLEWVPGREVEMDELTRELQMVRDPLESVPLIKRHFPEAAEVYLVIDSAYISPEVIFNVESEGFEVIKLYDHFSLVLLVLQD